MASARTTYDRLPLSFEAGPGRTAAGVRFQARGSGYTLLLTANDAELLMGANAVKPATSSVSAGAALLRFHMVGANLRPAIAAEERLPGTVNFLRGADQRAWQRVIPTYAAVKYGQIYPGIDLRYYGTQGSLEYDFRLAPRADARRIREDVAGARGLRVAPTET